HLQLLRTRCRVVCSRSRERNRSEGEISAGRLPGLQRRRGGTGAGAAGVARPFVHRRGGDPAAAGNRVSQRTESVAGAGESALRDIEGQMATVILGRLVISTLLNLVVLPTLELGYGRFERLGATLSPETSQKG